MKTGKVGEVCYEYSDDILTIRGLSKETDITNFLERAIQGYTHEDLWDIDAWFTSIIPRMLQEFKEKSHGCIPGDLYFENGKYIPDKPGVQEEWDAIIDRMIFCFTEANTCIFPFDEKEEAHGEQMKNEGLELFRKYFGNLWW